MITISACLIVKNEAAVLARCLESIKNLVDEIIIVDTGSSDQTKEIARHYTEQIYDFTWQDDFSAARNFAFSKAHMDYIYSADADEMLDEENQERFRILKEAMLPEIEIVQMHYITDMRFNTTENYVRDKRPKLFKRLRSFTWIEPIHEMVNLEPIVFDSDVEILHLPVSKHQKRDFSIFEKIIKRGEGLSDRLLKMYTRELYLSGEKSDFEKAEKYLLKEYDKRLETENMVDDITKMLAATICKGAFLLEEDNVLTKIALFDMTSGGSAEVCCALGSYYLRRKEYRDALHWYLCAAHRTESYLDVHSSGDEVLSAIAGLYAMDGKLQDLKKAEAYRKMAEDWCMEYGMK